MSGHLLILGVFQNSLFQSEAVAPGSSSCSHTGRMGWGHVLQRVSSFLHDIHSELQSFYKNIFSINAMVIDGGGRGAVTLTTTKESRNNPLPIK